MNQSGNKKDFPVLGEKNEGACPWVAMRSNEGRETLHIPS